LRFLAGFIAACVTGCPVFCNPSWVKQEWQQVFKLVQPDLILGYGDWGLAVRDYYPSPQPAILNPEWIMIPTGGSSGQIRFAIHTWQTLMASAGFSAIFPAPAGKFVLGITAVPCQRSNAILRSFTTGGQLVVLPFKELLAGVKCDIDPGKFFISLVPTQLQRLLENPTLATWLSRFQTVLLGGAPAWPELLEQARNYGIRLAPTYGMTETASGIVTLKPDDFLRGTMSCGQVLPHAK
jgi:O-succinylbenzoic acid--CoA ligase